ncbi:hypothetical protein LAA31_002531 [Salmonella enterica subsp. enterica serovar Enteritidis]|jgi:hypothetical protein|nr:hypothetical protein [Salmonella enterica subsp. enterica serovar Enteritidis]EJZ0099724.1 hypothetical protein [Escherichia coli]DAY64663.1 MAG TPA: hypothetical protein [Caudoviricetes sp.]HAR9088882.1 hypothetical protein [Salmonella enterica]
MSRRKKKPAYNPRTLAKKELRESVKSVYKLLVIFEEQMKILAERIDKEREVLEALEEPEYKAFAIKALDEAKAAFVGLMAEGKEKLGAKLIEIDKVATNAKTMLENNSWASVKDEFSVESMNVTTLETEAVWLGKDIQGAAIEILSLYNGRADFVKRAMHQGHTFAEAYELLQQAEAAVKQPDTEVVTEV